MHLTNHIQAAKPAPAKKTDAGDAPSPAPSAVAQSAQDAVSNQPQPSSSNLMDAIIENVSDAFATVAGAINSLADAAQAQANANPAASAVSADEKSNKTAYTETTPKAFDTISQDDDGEDEPDTGYYTNLFYTAVMTGRPFHELIANGIMLSPERAFGNITEPDGYLYNYSEFTTTEFPPATPAAPITKDTQGTGTPAPLP